MDKTKQQKSREIKNTRALQKFTLVLLVMLLTNRKSALNPLTSKRIIRYTLARDGHL